MNIEREADIILNIKIINFIIAAMDYVNAQDAYINVRDKLDFWGPTQL